VEHRGGGNIAPRLHFNHLRRDFAERDAQATGAQVKSAALSTLIERAALFVSTAPHAGTRSRRE
jgi:hypothetical protein